MEGVQGEFKPVYYHAQHYYHVLCFKAIMDLDKMIPLGKFICSVSVTWGLLIRKWFQYRGWINKKVLVEYIKEREEWDKKHYGRLSLALIKALFTDTKR